MLFSNGIGLKNLEKQFVSRSLIYQGWQLNDKKTLKLSIDLCRSKRFINMVRNDFLIEQVISQENFDIVSQATVHAPWKIMVPTCCNDDGEYSTKWKSCTVDQIKSVLNISSF